MRFELPLILAFAVNALGSCALERRGDDEYSHSDGTDYGGDGEGWKPKAKEPHFFNIKIDEKCDYGEDSSICQLENFAVRLENGIAIATPYNKWWDPKVPTFFVDDDTQLYTVSRQALQLYIDAATGALKYTKVGWLPPNAIATSFFHTGNNPLGTVDPSPSYLTWPSTQGITQGHGTWWLCQLGYTGQWQVFVNYANFESAGVNKVVCEEKGLAAVNANPWRKESGWGQTGGGI